MKTRKQEKATEALSRATNSLSLTNFPTIIQGFVEKGIPKEEILPRENVFTFDAWIALGRVVKKGEHGIRVITFIPVKEKDTETGEVKVVRTKPWATTVFHVSQTKELEATK